MIKALVAGTVAVLAAHGAFAQDSGWTYTATFNAWLPDVTSSIGTDFGTVETEASISDVLENLDMVLMGSFVAQRDRLGFVADLLYLDLSAERDTPFAVFGGAEADIQSTIASGYALYRVTSDPAFAFDIGAGLRAFDVDIDLALTPGIAAGRSLNVGGSWVDPVLAARLTAPLDEDWSLLGFADWGGSGGGDQSWQVLGAVKYDFNDRWSTEIGYRFMAIDKDLDGQDVSLDLGGPIVAFGLRF
jgi:hypothetical protein